MRALLLPYHLLGLLPVLFLAACGPSPEPEREGGLEVERSAADLRAPQLPLLTPLWTLDGFAEPESVHPLPDGSFAVSLVGGDGTTKDGDGGIARISRDGELLEMDWVTGLNAPKGFASVRDRLFVTDIDRMVEIDTKSGEVGRTLEVPGAVFLNDPILVGGTLYVSDSRQSRIYAITRETPEIWLEDARLDGVNGLHQRTEGELIVSTMGAGTLLSIDIATKEITDLADGMENADGIADVSDGGYIVSSWPGTLWRVRANSTNPEVLVDTTETPILANDILRDGDMLLVPNWRPGSVTAYRIND